MMKRGVAVFSLLFSIDTMFGCFRFHISRSTQNTCIPKVLVVEPDPKLVKCLGAYHTASATCHHEICASYWTRKVAIQEDCWKAIVETDGDCANYVFYKLHNDFFQASLKNHCSSKASPSSAPTKAN